MAIKILYGGFARPSFSVKDDNYATTFDAGQIVTLDTDSTVILADDTTTGLVGVVLDYKLSEKQDSTKGSKKAGVMIDPAVIETDQVATGVSPTVNADLYISAGGKFTTASGSLKVGKVISYSGGKLVALFNPQY